MSVAVAPAEPAGARAVTCCGLQSAGVKVRVGGENVTRGLSDAGVTVTSLSGRVFSATVYVVLLPCTTLIERGETVTPGSSSSVMLTVVSFGVPVFTRSGRPVPNPSSTLSPSSSSLSYVALKVSVRPVCPLANVTLDGTE